MKKQYFKEMISIGLPITLQSILEASYSLIDQLMVGRLGTVSIAGSGLGAKFSGLVLVTISAIASVASILIAQYHGSKDEKGMNQSFFSCFYIASMVVLLFTGISFVFPNQIMGIYTQDAPTIIMAAKYLKIIAISFIPMTVTMLVSAYLRSVEMSRYPMYAGIVSMILNISLDYILIFGKFGAPKLGLVGAAIGTLIGRSIEMTILVIWLLVLNKKSIISMRRVKNGNGRFYKKISVIILPILLNEFLWSLGENIYAAIYGRLGRDSLAAVTITGPMQGLFIGMFSGISAATVVMVGKRLGKNDTEEAYHVSKYLMKVGLIGSFIIGGFLISIAGLYVKLFNIEIEVATLSRYVIYAFAIMIFAKIGNMILSGGVLRSGGDTRITLVIDLIGTWVFGVPLGLITAYVFKLPVYQVYFILSLEEVVRLGIGYYVFRSRRWMKNITKEELM